jgi:hypothetical protein
LPCRGLKIDGYTLLGEKAVRDIWVCGPGAFVVLKALAFNKRGENKDAYDLFYMIRNYGVGVDDVYECLYPLLEDAETQEALGILRRDFSEPEYIGPSRVARFLYEATNPELQADVAGFVRALLSKCI